MRDALAITMPSLSAEEKAVIATLTVSEHYGTSGITTENKRCQSTDIEGKSYSDGNGSMVTNLKRDALGNAVLIPYNDALNLSITDASKYKTTTGDQLGTRTSAFRKLQEALAGSVEKPTGFLPKTDDYSMSLHVSAAALQALFDKSPHAARAAKSASSTIDITR